MFISCKYLETLFVAGVFNEMTRMVILDYKCILCLLLFVFCIIKFNLFAFKVYLIWK